MKAFEQWVAFQTIFQREVRRYTRIWLQTLVPPMITTGLYFVIFGNLIGQRIGPMDGFAYMEFIVPGLIMMAVITNSYSNVVSSFYNTKFQRCIEEMLVSPMPNYVILLGYVLGGVSRGLAVGALVTGLAILFMDLHIHSLWITGLVISMTAVLFSLGGFVNAVFANSFDDISIIPTFVLTPLTYLGGVFYSIQMLPDAWQWVSKANPILYMVNAFRYGFLGTSDIPVGASLVLIAVFSAGLFAYCMYLLNRGVGIRT